MEFHVLLARKIPNLRAGGYRYLAASIVRGGRRDHVTMAVSDSGRNYMALCFFMLARLGWTFLEVLYPVEDTMRRKTIQGSQEAQGNS
jgi:hypothetical protein